MNTLFVLCENIPIKKIPIQMNSTSWLIIGSIIALFILIYLIITLIKPEKF